MVVVVMVVVAEVGYIQLREEGKGTRSGMQGREARQG